MLTEIECILFAGPSLPQVVNLPELLQGVELHPPIRRGDLPTLMRDKAQGVIAIADGRFHQSLAVGHAEIREAIQAGWNVWGLSSMGAIRAFEMRQLGMMGYGDVYARFISAEINGIDFQDDEVALIHEELPPYRAKTEPLVHMRVALENWITNGKLTRTQADKVVTSMKTMWYGDRTLSAFKTALHEFDVDLTCELTNFDRFRVKSIDLQQFFVERPWKPRSSH